MVRKRATIYFEPKVHRALRRHAAASECSMSDLVNDAVRAALAEDAQDLRVCEERAGEPDLDFDTIVRSLKQRGKI